MLHRPRARSILIIAGVLVALAMPLMFLLEDFMREAIVMPLAYQAWLVGVVVRALPEGCLLMPVVGLAAYLAVRSLPRRREAPTSVKTQHRASVGTTRMWYERIEHVRAGTYSRERLEHYVGQCVMSVIGYENRLSMREALGLIESGDIAVPSDVRQFAEAAFRGGAAPKRSGLARFVKGVLRLLQGRRAVGMSMAEISERVNPALAYIEEELRMTHLEAKDEQ
ncbi:MAG: hypothetical protein MUF84_06450 [Anaerolineae bacterium]|jgi:hypothetical protein|nr:hypothetical protein [Anaerolineae bacterium]